MVRFPGHQCACFLLTSVECKIFTRDLRRPGRTAIVGWLCDTVWGIVSNTAPGAGEHFLPQVRQCETRNQEVVSPSRAGGVSLDALAGKESHSHVAAISGPTKCIFLFSDGHGMGFQMMPCTVTIAPRREENRKGPLGLACARSLQLHGLLPCPPARGSAPICLFALA